MNRNLCLVICFFVGIIIFYLLNQSCGCNVVEGSLLSDSTIKWWTTPMKKGDTSIFAGLP